MTKRSHQALLGCLQAWLQILLLLITSPFVVEGWSPELCGTCGHICSRFECAQNKGNKVSVACYLRNKSVWPRPLHNAEGSQERVDDERVANNDQALQVAVISAVAGAADGA